MKTAIVKLVTAGVFFACIPAYAAIYMNEHLHIDFADRADAASKATWQKKVTRPHDHWWMLTNPLSLGLSWRPPLAASVRVSIELDSPESTDSPTARGAGDVYVRYSPDLKHWSTWQSLESDIPLPPEPAESATLHYRGTISVPKRETNEYGNLLSEYSQQDVPWTSDEEAAVRWILQRDPDFFSKYLPFIGYVQFLYEDGYPRRGAIRLFDAEISYGMGGLHSPAQDEEMYRERFGLPWRFDANREDSPEPDGPTAEE